MVHPSTQNLFIYVITDQYTTSHIGTAAFGGFWSVKAPLIRQDWKLSSTTSSSSPSSMTQWFLRPVSNDTKEDELSFASSIADHLCSTGITVAQMIPLLLATNTNVRYIHRSPPSSSSSPSSMGNCYTVQTLLPSSMKSLTADQLRSSSSKAAILTTIARHLAMYNRALSRGWVLFRLLWAYQSGDY
jgi:hypothetical protein